MCGKSHALRLDRGSWMLASTMPALRGWAAACALLLLCSCGADRGSAPTTDASVAPEAEERTDTTAPGLKPGDPTSAQIIAALSDYTADGLRIDDYKVPAEFVQTVAIDSLQARKVDRREGVEYFDATARAIVRIKGTGAQIAEGGKMKWKIGMDESDIRAGVFDQIRASQAMEDLPSGARFEFPVSARFHTIDGNVIIDEAHSDPAKRYFSEEERAATERRDALVAAIRDAAVAAGVPRSGWERFVRQQLDKARYGQGSVEEYDSALYAALLAIQEASPPQAVSAAMAEGASTGMDSPADAAADAAEDAEDVAEAAASEAERADDAASTTPAIDELAAARAEAQQARREADQAREEAERARQEAQQLRAAAAAASAPSEPATEDLDAQYRVAADRCAPGFLGKACRHQLRESLCAGHWSPSPPANQEACRR